MLQKKLRRRVKQRPAGQLGASGDADQPTVQQRLENTARIHPANRFHLRARQRLAVGDDGERLQRGRTQPRRAALGKQLPHPRRAGRQAVEMPAGDGLGESEGAFVLPVMRGQGGQRVENVLFPAAGKRGGERFFRELGGGLQRRAHLGDGQRFGGSEQKSFEHLRQRHREKGGRRNAECQQAKTGLRMFLLPTVFP